MSGNRGRGGVDQAIIKKGKYTKKSESRSPASGGKGQASSSPTSEDGNNKELLNSICQLHRQIRADYTPAKDCVSAIDALKTEIQNLICELDDSEERTEAPQKPAKPKPGDRNATASGTNKSKDLLTVATATRDRCRKLEGSLLKTRKELKEISELAIVVGQEDGFQPDTINAGKDKGSLSLSALSAKDALEDIKERNRALSEELNDLSKKLEIYSTDQTKQQPKQRNDKNQQQNRTQQPQTINQASKKNDKSKDKKDHKSSQFYTNLEIISKAVSSFDDLQHYKGKLKEISELAIAVGQEVGFMPDTSNAGKDKDSLSVNAKEALEDIKQRNRTLSEELNKLSKNIESYSTDQTEQQSKQSNDKNQPPIGHRQQHPPQTNKAKIDQSDVKRDHKSSQVDINLEIISKVVSHVDDLQQYKRQMNPLVQHTIRLCMKEEDNLSKGESVFVQLKRAVKDIDVDLQEFGRLQSEYRTLSEELNKLSKNIEIYSTDQTEQQSKQSNDKNQPPIGHRQQHPPQTNKGKKDQSDVKRDHKSSQVDTNLEIISKVVSHVDDLQQYKRQMNPLVQRTIRLCMREEDNLSKGESVFVQLERAVKDIDVDLQEFRRLKSEYRAFEANMSQVLAFAMDLEELIGPKEGSGTFNPSFVMEEKNKKDKGRSKKEGEGHDGSNADPPVGFDNRKFEQALQLLPKVYKILKDELNKMDQLAKRAIQLTMKEGDQPIQDKTLLSQLERAIEDIEGDFKKLRQLETKNRDEIQKLKREIELKVKEKEALHNRLSKLAGNKMTEGNPNIANLGDPNRPTKIAEIYSEIYDNEWTDALDFCQKKLKKEYSEDDALQALNKTLIFCYKICQGKSDEWVEKTKGVLKRCSDELMVDIQSEEILMQIIDGRKAVSDQMSKQLLKEIRPKNDLQVPTYAKEMNSKLYKMIIQNKFFEKCFTLCWKMIVQNPRMILVEGPPRGNTYDRTIFREFTSSGSKVVFTVWPALYLHEGGPLLVKGVVKVE